jgi:hypothetical protein
MNSTETVHLKKYPHEIISNEFFNNIETYNKFLNWISGEYDLYLQDGKEDLKIYFPNGILKIEKQNTNTITAEISFHTSNLNTGNSIINNVHSIYTRLNAIYN